MFGLIGWIGRILLILLIVRMIVSMFSSSGRGAATGPKASRGGRGDRGGNSEKTVAKLVRDPQCGTYVAENTAIAATHGGQTLHFCSERCRDEYLASPRATAV
jgi:YHS domain-containing protein